MRTKLVIESILGFGVLFTLIHFFFGQIYNFQEEVQMLAMISILLSGLFYLLGKGRRKKAS